MIISILLICAIAFGGFAFTYLIWDDETFMWRLAAGNVIGAGIFGLAAFGLALGFGLNGATVLAGLAIALAPLILLRKKEFGAEFVHDWAKAKGKLQGGTLKRFSGFGYYFFFFATFWLFFGQAMYETGQGIFTGGSQNLGDLPFHLGAIFSFTDGNNFPPQNPSFAGAKFSYPFIADFVTACFVRLGADVKDAMFVQNISWAFSLLVILERFGTKITGSKLAGRITPFLLFFSGGLGFIWFLQDYWGQGKSIWEFIWALPRDYTIGDQFRWGNSMVVMFITQRSLLIGMPIALIVLGYLWSIFQENGTRENDSELTEVHRAYSWKDFPLSAVLVGGIAGMLPLIHLHSLAVLFVVTAFLLVMRPSKWLTWVAFGAGVCAVALPELIWSVTGSASDSSKFIGWHFGWDNGKYSFWWFWFKNTGFVIPTIIAGLALLIYQLRSQVEGEQRSDTTKIRCMLFFYVPFAVLFIVSNVVKLAPWEWDNIKVLIYWFVGSAPIIAYAIAWAWGRDRVAKGFATVCFILLTFSGALDVWRTATGQIKSGVFDTDAIRIAEQIKAKTPAKTLFLNAPTYNSAVVLSGRQSFMRYSGHLSSHGIDYSDRESKTRRIYEGGGVSEIFLRENNIEYVLISPEERNSMKANEEFFKKYPVLAESGQYRVYKIK